MRVLSLFDGISCGMVALERAGIPVERYVAYEIEPNAIKISKKNYPQIEHCGDVTTADFTQYQGFDLLIGGSPCQGFSFAGKQLNFADPRSKLFFEFERALKENRPRYFLLENVKMKKAFADVITERLGVEPIEINSSLVSAQNRKRLYWTNIPNVQRPADRGIVLCDILENGLAWRDKSYTIDANYWKTSGRYNPERQSTRRAQVAVAVGYRNRREEDGNLYRRFETSGLDKANALTTVQTDSMVALGISCRGRKDKSENHAKSLAFAPGTDGEPIYEVCNGEIEITGRKYKINLPDGVYAIRKFTPTECERLQTLPDGYTEGVSKTWRYKCIGNGWTVDVIAHILKSLA